jgi:hypothetical protein
VAKSGYERTVLGRRIAATDQEINQLVYQLYGLTGQDIAVVEDLDNGSRLQQPVVA